MKKLYVFILLSAIALPSLFFASSVAKEGSSPACHFSLHKYKWTHRVLIYRVEDAVELEALYDFAHYEKNNLIERKLLIIGMYNGLPVYVSRNRVCAKAELAPNSDAKVVLIGLDGEVKGQYDFFDIDFIYSEIDKMPMRRREMSLK